MIAFHSSQVQPKTNVTDVTFLLMTSPASPPPLWSEFNCPLNILIKPPSKGWKPTWLMSEQWQDQVSAVEEQSQAVMKTTSQPVPDQPPSSLILPSDLRGGEREDAARRPGPSQALFSVHWPLSPPFTLSSSFLSLLQLKRFCCWCEHWRGGREKNERYSGPWRWLDCPQPLAAGTRWSSSEPRRD